MMTSFCCIHAYDLSMYSHRIWVRIDGSRTGSACKATSTAIPDSGVVIILTTYNSAVHIIIHVYLVIVCV